MGDFPTQNKPGTALVFGGCGTLGSHIVEALHADGSFSSIFVASRNPTRWCTKDAYYTSCDISSAAQVLDLLDEIKPQVIFHSVAPSSNADEEIQYRINYQSTKQLLDIAGDHPSVRALIYTGSARSIASECHSRTTPLTEEEAVLHDLFSNGVPYERTKGAADALVRARSTGDTAKIALKGIDFHGSLSTAVIRVPALYGRRDLRTSGQMMKRANTRATCIQLGDNAAKHEWLYLDNAARAHVLAAKALLAGQEGVDGEAFFVTDGAPVNFWDFSRKLWAEAGDTSCSDPDSIRVIPMWLVLTLATISEWVFWILTLGTKKPSLSAHQLRYISRGTWWSIGKARERLGYEPLCGTDEGIRRTVEWFRHNKS